MKDKIQKIAALLSDESFAQRVQGLQTPEEILKAFSEQGVDLTAAELKEIGKQALAASNGEELDEEALENVAGGISFSSLLNIIRIFGPVRFKS